MAQLPPSQVCRALLSLAAGGFDAIYALCVRTPEARAAVEGCWMGFRGRIVVPLMLTAEPDDPVHGGVRLSRGHPL